eukprot:TRINITY_DN3794_c0_g1_i1.p1 TRINITY_DN3794_c0_g1~~TRINITY_DN3794_c0_g1_i1.p1  ORF type:complete len:147 (-),score=38.45 TRINITY_DN3794_c0_g1_i1:22-462(-)
MESDSSDGAPECIVDEKFENGELLYLIKWKGYGNEDNTWESPSNLPQGKLNSLVKKWDHLKIGEVPSHVQINNPTGSFQIGFEYGDTVQEIVGCKKENDNLYHYVLWKNKNICTYVPHTETIKYAIEEVLDFYESRIKFEKSIITD